MKVLRASLASLLTIALIGCQGAATPSSEAAARGEVAQARVSLRSGTGLGRPRVVFLGDSLTAGYGLAREESVPALVQARMDTAGYAYDVVNAGVSGDTSAGGLSRLEWSLEGEVAVLVVELGANDGLRGLPVVQMRANLAEIITRAKRRGIEVILTGMEAPPNYGAAYTEEFRRAFPSLAAEHDVRFLPFYLDGVAGVPSLNIADGMHPNSAGSQIIADSIWAVLEPVLDKSSND